MNVYIVAKGSGMNHTNLAAYSDQESADNHVENYNRFGGTPAAEVEVLELNPNRPKSNWFALLWMKLTSEPLVIRREISPNATIATWEHLVHAE